MTREIKFRAKSLKSGKWVYGYYVEENTEQGPICQIYDGENYVLVDSETVGQFTGIGHKNGTEIYVGDLVKVIECVNRGDGTWDDGVFEIVMEDGAFQFKDFDILSEWFEFGGGDLEVIGNIHENPELVKH